MKGRNSLNNINSNYFKVFNNLFDLGLSVHALGVAVYMLSKTEYYNPGVKEISLALGTHRNTVYNSLKELQTCNVISLVREGSKGRVAVYKLNMPVLWVKTLERQLQESLYNS